MLTPAQTKSLGLVLLGVVASCVAPEEPNVLDQVVELELELEPVKQLHFEWAAIAGAEHYQVFARDGEDGEFIQLGEDTSETSFDATVALHLQTTASYRLSACDAVSCQDSEIERPSGSLAPAIGYFKPEAPNKSEKFGSAVAISADGKVLAVGAAEAKGDRGTVTVFMRDSEDTWTEIVVLEAANADSGDLFGFDLALDSTGETLVVGAPEEDGGEDGTSAKQNSGAAYVFVQSEGLWTQEAYLKAPNYDLSNLKISDRLGASVAVNASGDTVAVGANKEGDQSGSGAVYIYTRTSEGWDHEDTVKGPVPAEGDEFGLDLALDASGDLLAVGAPFRDGQDIEDSGAVYIFTRSLPETGEGEANWNAEPATLEASNQSAGSEFGRVALNADGTLLVVGAQRPEATGSVYVFARSPEGEWSEQFEFVDPSPAGERNEFGAAIAVNAEGNLIAITAPEEASNATGIDQDPADITAYKSGAAHVFGIDGGSWATGPTRSVYIKAPNSGEGDEFGTSVALSGAGDILALGAPLEDGSGAGVSASDDDDASNAGAVYLY